MKIAKMNLICQKTCPPGGVAYLVRKTLKIIRIQIIWQKWPLDDLLQT